MIDAEGIEQVTLEHGELRFTARIAGSGPLVMFLHGFPDSEVSFDSQLRALSSEGFRAVAVRMRGYEPSSQPADDDYHAVRMAEDVLAWIAQLGETKVHLVGHDWGSLVAQAATSLAPQAISSLVMMAVPRLAPLAAFIRSDPAQARRSSYRRVINWGSIADLIVTAANFAYLGFLWRRWSPGWTIPPRLLAGMKQRFSEPGVVHAALAYYRQAQDRDSVAGKQSAQLLLKPISVPTLGLYGANDGCIGAEIFERSMPPSDFLASLQMVRIDGAGHFFHLEQPNMINTLLLDWLSEAKVRCPN